MIIRRSQFNHLKALMEIQFNRTFTEEEAKQNLAETARLVSPLIEAEVIISDDTNTIGVNANGTEEEEGEEEMDG